MILPGEPRSIYSLSVAHLVTDLYMPVITAILPVLIATYGYSYFLAGLLVTSYNITSSLTQPLFGWLSDRYGWQVHVSTSLLISAVFVSLFGLFSNYEVLLVCAALAAIGHACFHPNAFSLVSRMATQANRGRITSIFVVGGNLGYALGPLLAGAMVLLFGLEGVLLLIIPAVLMAFILRRVLPPVKPERNPHPAPGTRDLWSLIKSPITLLFLASTLRAWAVFTVIAFFPPVLIERGYDIFTANLLVTLMLLAGVCGQVAGGILSDAYGKKEFVILGLLLSVPCFMLFFLLGGVLSVLALLAFGFSLWSSFAVTIAMAHELMPQNVGMTSGLLLGVAIGAGGIGVAVAGIIADRYSLLLALSTVPILIIGAVLLMLMVRYPWKIFAGKPVL